jgi:putative ABC transport system ATP-binding protein
MDNVILRSENLRKEYRLSHDNSNCVIPGLGLEIRKGEFVVIMGNSGSGKSTLLYLLSGLEDLTGGQVYLKGNPIPAGQKGKAIMRRSLMGFVFQQHNLIPSLTLLENILVAAFLVHGDRKESKDKAVRLMGDLGIEKLHDRYPAQVSGGEQQRCSIARALVNSPEILLADEPTGSLNSSSTANVLQIFSSLHAKGQTIIMVTHAIEAACYGERIVYLRDGAIVDEYGILPDLTRTEKERDLLTWLTKKGW